MDHFGKSMTDLSNRVNELHKINDIQKRRLVDTREEVKGVLDKEVTLRFNFVGINYCFFFWGGGLEFSLKIR